MTCRDIFVSALGAVYAGDKAIWLEEALRSLLNQTRRPDEIILVIDGGIDSDLEGVIKLFSRELSIVRLENNCGLANALNCGIMASKGDVLVRYDSDDINDPCRIEKLLDKYVQLGPNYIIGSWVQEFGDSDKLRTVPQNSWTIKKKLGYRCVMNHPSVLYSKNLINKIGGYQTGIFPEDYLLWLRARQKGFMFYNIPEVLVKMRTNEDFYSRRSGMKYAMKEYTFYMTARKEKLLSLIEFSCSLPLRFLFRVMPSSIIKYLYIKLLRK